MSHTLQLEIPQDLLPIVLGPVISNQKFENLCLANPEMVMEREVDGSITIMSPVSPISGNREVQIMIELGIYARQANGKVFSSSTGFRLPDSSVRSPDASFVFDEQLSNFSKEELRHFAPIVPEFVVEITSPTDSLKDAEKKMKETWIGNGVKLAWLIDVDADKLWIYRADGSVDLVTPLDQVVTGEDVLPGFEFDLTLLT